MASLPTDDDKARLLLDVFRQLNARPGETIMKQSIMTVPVASGFRLEDRIDGLVIASNRGWIEERNDTIIITDAGFAEL